MRLIGNIDTPLLLLQVLPNCQSAQEFRSRTGQEMVGVRIARILTHGPLQPRNFTAFSRQAATRYSQAAFRKFVGAILIAPTRQESSSVLIRNYSVRRAAKPIASIVECAAPRLASARRTSGLAGEFPVKASR